MTDDYWKKPEVLKKHAMRRRERYAKDPEVAKAERARQRKIYREKLGVKFKNPARDAIVRGIEDRDYTGAEVSALLDRAPEYVNRLIVRGLWPDPRNGHPTQQVIFTGAQTRALLTVMAKHIDDVANTYRADHTDTKAALFAAMNEETAE